MSTKDLVFTRPASGLVKAMSWWDIALIGISAPAGSGILYYSVSTASTYPGANVALSFLVGLLLFFPIAFLGATTSTMIPRSGSLYVLVSRVLGPTIGHLAAFLFYIGYSLAVGVVAYVFVGVLSGIVALGGSLGGSPLLRTLAGIMLQPGLRLVISIGLLTLVWISTLQGVHVFRDTMRSLFVITLGSGLVTIIYFMAVSGSTLRARFDGSWGTGAFEGIITLARSKGWGFPGFSWHETINALLVVLWAYGGIELVNYASGEVRQAGRNLFRGLLTAWAVLGLLYSGLAFSVTRAFGQFLGAYDFLFKNHRDLLATVMTPVDPSIPFYVSSTIGNPWLGLILALGTALWLVNTMIPYFFAPSRLIFALAMDKAVPPWLARVSERRGAPTWATHLTFGFAILGVLLNLLQVEVVLGTILFCVFFIFWLYGLAAVLLPSKRPDIYAMSPVQRSILGVPVISLVGLAAFGVGWFLLFFTIRQMTVGISIGASIVIVLCLLVYLYQYRKNIKVGVPVESIYAEIPPA